MENKMKYCFAFVQLLFLSLNIFAQNFTVDLEFGYYYVYVFDNIIFCVDFLSKEYTEIPRKNSYLDDEGYLHLDLPKPIHYDGKHFVLNGKYYEEIFPENYINSEHIRSDFTEYDYYQNSLAAWITKHFKTVRSSAYLQETIGGKKIEYAPMNLFLKATPSFEKEITQLWNNTIPPWVEGNSDAGIGAYIEIEFLEPVKTISILNGYVDLINRRLFKRNNRVKTLQVQDIDNKKEYTMDFEDYVYFNGLPFDVPTKHIKLVIKEVYNGTMYNDTCISAITFSSDIYAGEYQFSSEVELKRQIAGFALMK
jgi:hypothetical protein